MNFRPSFDAWDSVVDALAEELSAMPKPGRDDLIERLIVRGGYESADPGPSRAERVEETRRALLQRLAVRLAQGQARSVTADAA